MSFFRKRKQENSTPNEARRSAPSRFVLDLAKLKKEKEARESVDKNFFHIKKENQTRKKKAVASAYVSKIFDAPEKEASKDKDSDAIKNVFSRNPGLLDRILIPLTPVKNYFLRVGGFVVAVVLILFAFKIVSWTNQAKETKGQILGAATTAFEDLLNGADLIKVGEFQNGEDVFKKAQAEFSNIQNKLGGINQLLVSLAEFIPNQGSAVESGRHLIDGGQELSLALAQFSKAAPRWFSGGGDFLENLSAIKKDIKEVSPRLTAAKNEFAAVDPKVLPQDYRQSFEQARTAVSSASDKITMFGSMADGLTDLLGANGERRFLVLFQNNRELRPTGGFIGSFSLIDVKKGKIENIETPQGGPYDIKPNLTEFLKPPQPVQYINSRWEIQDANWFPDFPTSAKKFQWFYDKSGGPTVDGVIAITPNVLTRLLKAVGPLEIPEYQMVVNDANVLDFLQNQTENSLDKKENVPKKIIAVMLPKLLEKTLSLDLRKGAEVLGVLADSLNQKDILLYVNNQTVQTAFEDLDWSGMMKSTDGDYLMVNGANLGGGKTDQVVDELIDLRTKIKEDGGIVNTLTITRKHNGSPFNQFENWPNQEFIRVYVPEGSTFISAKGFDGPTPDKMFQSQIPLSEDEDLANIEGSPVIDEKSGTRITQEFGKTVFGNWMTVKPGEFEQAIIEYELPFKAQKSNKSFLSSFFGQSADLFPYSLTVQKQPGKISRLFASMEMPNNMAISWNSSNSKLIDRNKIEFSKTIDRDAVYGLVAQIK